MNPRRVAQLAAPQAAKVELPVRVERQAEEMQVGRRIAFAVESSWYRTLEAHNFLRGGQLDDHPTDLLLGTIESDDINGVWIKPDERFSEFSKSSLLVPWRYILAASLLGPDEESKLLGFHRP
jgi:hypothetical protein